MFSPTLVKKTISSLLQKVVNRGELISASKRKSKLGKRSHWMEVSLLTSLMKWNLKSRGESSLEESHHFSLMVILYCILDLNGENYLDTIHFSFFFFGKKRLLNS